jgi:hypothetical protein
VAGTAPEARTADIAKAISIDRKDRRRSTRAAFFLFQKAYQDRYRLAIGHSVVGGRVEE